MGEATAASDITRWIDEVRLFNEYGPAECSIIASVHQVTTSESDHRAVGRGTGCVCWVVDPQDHGKLLPLGAVGEFLIGGPIVGRGYLNNPEKTAATFIDPPAWLREFRAAHPGNPGGDRVYKTSDLVQYAVDGLLRFVGRKDTQVKLRGQRIELSEVEYHTEAGRAPTLVAFVWAAGEDAGNGADHRQPDEILLPPTDTFCAAIPAAEAGLHDAVPTYMMPAVFLPVAGIPLTATGKTDRRRLRERAAALPRAELEAISGPAFWPEDIGADDSFFRLGGDSIGAMQLAGVARENGLHLTVAHVFQQPKLSQLAYTVQAVSDVAAHIPPVFSLLEEGSPRDPLLRLAMDRCHVSNDQITNIYPCTALQEGLFALTAKTAGTYVAHFSYRLPFDTDLDCFRAA
ncbi:hypothetical protein BDV59DRAFT_205091 [Aspergillus ambiguus]|uniref:uncharacterized protein n=1 Tax=Aspergillus ambiguus TaxID=176160 RepID=UPI003CCD9890